MNYYIKGNAAKADQIKAAFERLGYDTSFVQNLSTSDSHILFTLPCDSRVHAFHTAYIEADVLKRLVDIDPDYQELEPLHKFKEGDLLVHNSSNTRFISVVDVSEKYGYQVQDGGSRHHLSFNVVENEYHLWTIQDAKDGDVLATDNGWTCIFKAFDGCVFSSYCFMDSQKWFCEFGSETHTLDSRINENIHPATKKQRNLLFAKMREAGYEWDADKKELRKIQHHYDISNFKPFDKVLVRDDDDEPWRIAFYGYYNKEAHYSHFVGVCWAKQCIPYNDDTKHLLGTTDMCDEQYINW